MHAVLDIDKVYTAPHRALDCRPGIGGLHKVNGQYMASSLRDVPFFNAVDPFLSSKPK